MCFRVGFSGCSESNSTFDRCFFFYIFQGSCPNCSESNSKFERLYAECKEKDKSIKDLKLLVTKFEKQLTQQDGVLKTWSESKGHKVNYKP